MDFNIYDFLGNPPEPKDKDNIQWCPHCLAKTARNEHWNFCKICGKSENET